MSGPSAAWALPLDERPPGLSPELCPHGDAEGAATSEESSSPPPRGGHSQEYDAALAASLLVLRAAYQAHVSLLMLDAGNPRNRIANRYASANLRRAVEALDTSTMRLDRKIEEALRP